MIRAERHHRPYAYYRRVLRPPPRCLVGSCFALGVEVLLAGQRLKSHEPDALAAFAPNAGLQQLVAPVSLPNGWTRAPH